METEDEDPIETRWAEAVEFHEFAEALALPTELIFTASNAHIPGVWFVSYSAEKPPDLPTEMWPDPYCVPMSRDEYGILRKVDEPKLMVGFWKRLHGEMVEHFLETSE
jgi:hypothetical protein